MRKLLATALALGFPVLTLLAQPGPGGPDGWGGRPDGRPPGPPPGCCQMGPRWGGQNPGWQQQRPGRGWQGKGYFNPPQQRPGRKWQGQGFGPQQQPRWGQQNWRQQQRQQRPPMPLVAALDPNHDGVIDAKEMKNSAKALQALDKNNDGQLTREELAPQFGHGGGPGSDRVGANRGGQGLGPNPPERQKQQREPRNQRPPAEDDNE